MMTNLFQSWLGRPTLIAAEDTWSLLALLLVSVALSIWLEQKYDWASKISGAIIALCIALLASNLSIIPTSCVLYDEIVWGYAVPLGIPLLLRIRYAVLPQIIPAFASAVLYRFDVNIREASVLGLVGAGGIGAPLIFAMNHYAWNEAGAIALGLIILVWVIDLLSAALRWTSA